MTAFCYGSREVTIGNFEYGGERLDASPDTSIWIGMTVRI